MQLGIRLIPVTISAAVLMLGLRLGDLWQHGAAQAQQPAAQSHAANPSPGAPAAPAESSPAAPVSPPPPAPRASDDQAGFSAAELEVLQGLAARRAALDERSGELDRRETLLRAAEGRIEAKVLELKQLQASVESALRRYDEQEDARRKSLVKIFESMKPKEAARIFEQMELPILVELMERMREARAAPILAEMNPARAKQVMAELAKRRQPGTNG